MPRAWLTAGVDRLLRGQPRARLHDGYRPQADIELAHLVKPRGAQTDMNARAVHKLMRRLFPSGIPGGCSYKVVLDENNQPRLDILKGLLVEQFQDGDIVVEVNRTVGGVFAHAEALGLIANNMSKSRIKVSNRDFDRFVVIEINGVAAGFSKAQLIA